MSLKQKFMAMAGAILLLVITLSAMDRPAAPPSGFDLFNENEIEHTRVVEVLVDMSGSFINKMTLTGEGYKMCLEIVHKYHRVGDRKDRLILAKISGNGKNRALIWDGEIREFK